MRYESEQLQLSASDLVGFLSCKHLTQLDLEVAAGNLAAPSPWDPMLKVLRERGFQHEQAYLDHLASSGLQQVQIDGVGIDDASVAATIAAMGAGTDIIVQAALRHNQWAGRADVLLKVDRPSKLGAWSYEVVDTKLARETKGGTILQLCLYSSLLAEAQGRSHLLASDFVARRRSSRNGVSLQFESAERRDVARQVRLSLGRSARRFRDGVQNAATDAVGQRLLSLSRVM